MLVASSARAVLSGDLVPGRGGGDLRQPAKDLAVGAKPGAHPRRGGRAVAIVQHVFAARPDQLHRALEPLGEQGRLFGDLMLEIGAE
jgi:hypothetical protein